MAVGGVVEESWEKNSRQRGSHVHSFPAKAFCGVICCVGLEYLTTSAIRPTAVERSERSRKSVEQGMGVGLDAGCHWERDSRVSCNDTSFFSRKSSSAVLSLVGFARLRISDALVLSSKWPICPKSVSEQLFLMREGSARAA